jgi:hypothetical protein
MAYSPLYYIGMLGLAVMHRGDTHKELKKEPSMIQLRQRYIYDGKTRW